MNSHASISSLLLLAPFASAQGAGPKPSESAASRPAQDERAGAPRPERLDATIVTATRRDEEVFDVPYSAFVLDADEVQNFKLRRSTPDAVSQLPQVMGQKTALGQGSPFLRGFTGYNTLFLIDGIRLNNSAFRSGPNQYWATVDPFSYERLEVVLGPGSVLYGSDAVGGVVNAFSNRRSSYEPGVHGNARLFFRWAEAESSFVHRVDLSGNVDDKIGIAAGLSYKDFGDLKAGNSTGVQRESGYNEINGDVRADIKLSKEWKFTSLYQRVDQSNVPRTHTTTFGESFEGTAVGTELRRDQDQRRDLIYGRVEHVDAGTPIDREQFTLYWHRQFEARHRVTSLTKADESNFEVSSPGIQGQITRDTDVGVITAGFEYQHDFVQSQRTNFTLGTAPVPEVQGSLGDNAGYDLAGIYVQDQLRVDDFELIPAIRYTYAHAYANQVDNPEVNGTSPFNPANVIDVSESWNNVSGSFRGVYHASEDVNFFGGVSQAFRAPTLADLTSLDETSAKEFPTPGLDPERFLQEEIGIKARGDGWTAQASYWLTQIDGLIIPSPTGELFGTTPVVRKSNVGDGYQQGAEIQGSLDFTKELTAFGWGSWQEGYVDQVRFQGTATPIVTRAPISRAMPLSGLLGMRYTGEGSRWYLEAVLRGSTKQDKLSLKDKTDTQRIPPGGTPGWLVADLRAGVRICENVLVTSALENVGNANYRIHGSGLNEAGVNFVIGLDIRF